MGGVITRILETVAVVNDRELAHRLAKGFLLDLRRFAEQSHIQGLAHR